MEKVAKRGVKKLLMSVLVMVVAIAAAGTSTFAWFTTNATPRLEPYETKVTAVDGLYIALAPNVLNGTDYKDLTYKANITKAEIETLINSTGSSAYSLVPATTQDGVSFKDAEGDNVSATGVSVNANADERAFFTYTIYFKAKDQVQIGLDFKEYAGNKRTYVTPGTDGDVSAFVPTEWLNSRPAPTGWTLDSDNKTVLKVDIQSYLGGGTPNELLPGDEINARAADSMRLSFTGRNDLATTTDVPYCWDPRAVATGSYQADLARDLYDAYQSAPLAAFTPPTNLKSAESDFDSLVLVKTETLTDGFYYGCITIRQWIEGNDFDCLNGIMDDPTTVSIQFKTIA